MSIFTDDKRKAMYRATIDKWGVDSQFNQAQEELAELVVAINKYRRGWYNSRAVLEEIADVEIMLEQLKEMLGFTPDLVEWYKETKLARLARILGMEVES